MDLFTSSEQKLLDIVDQSAVAPPKGDDAFEAWLDQYERFTRAAVESISLSVAPEAHLSKFAPRGISAASFDALMDAMGRLFGAAFADDFLLSREKNVLEAAAPFASCVVAADLAAATGAWSSMAELLASSHSAQQSDVETIMNLAKPIACP
jgi:hypothetical protein